MRWLLLIVFLSVAGCDCWTDCTCFDNGHVQVVSCPRRGPTVLPDGTIESCAAWCKTLRERATPRG